MISTGGGFIPARLHPHVNWGYRRKAKRMLEELGLSVATPSDAREMLKLKGARNVNF
jgi:hypothetical protein